MKRATNRYIAIIERIFSDRYKPGMTSFSFDRNDLIRTSRSLGVKAPSNLGDIIYSFRYRTAQPEAISEAAIPGHQWLIEGVAKGIYEFRLSPVVRIAPNPSLAVTKIPDATPEIVSTYSLSDEQALLAKVRYNRLVDIFLGITAYSLQGHLRTTVNPGIQVEIDEAYVGVDRRGRQFIIPVQAKGGTDKLAVVQTKQDLACCAEKFPQLICRPVSAQFMADGVIALFELGLQNGQIRVVEEKHYVLVLGNEISEQDLQAYDQ